MAVNNKKRQIHEKSRRNDMPHKETTNDIFIDQELNKELKLGLKLNGNRYRIHEIPRSRNILQNRRDI